MPGSGTRQRQVHNVRDHSHEAEDVRFESTTQHLGQPSYNWSYGPTKDWTYWSAIGDNVNRRWQRWNTDGFTLWPESTCDHVQVRKTDCVLVPWKAGNEVHGVTGTHVPVDIRDSGLLPWELWELIPSPPSAVLSGLRVEAAMAFADQVPTELDLYNFVRELPELVDLLGFVPDFRQQGHREAFGLKLHDLFLAARDYLVNGYLTHSYAIAPTLDDLQKIARIQSKVSARLAELRATWGKFVPVHFRRRDPWIPDPLPTATAVRWSRHIRYRATAVRTEFNANVTLFHKLRGLNEPTAEAQTLAAMLGATDIGSSAWNQLSGSFLLSWVDGGATERFITQAGRTPDFPGLWNTSGPSNSWKIVTDFVVEQHFDEAWNPPVAIGSGTIERYIRAPGLPVNYADVGLTGLSPKQATLWAAMMVTMHG